MNIQYLIQSIKYRISYKPPTKQVPPKATALPRNNFVSKVREKYFLRWEFMMDLPYNTFLFLALVVFHCNGRSLSSDCMEYPCVDFITPLIKPMKGLNPKGLYSCFVWKEWYMLDCSGMQIRTDLFLFLQI